MGVKVTRHFGVPEDNNGTAPSLVDTLTCHSFVQQTPLPALQL